jgi:hypothetical protein
MPGILRNDSAQWSYVIISVIYTPFTISWFTIRGKEDSFTSSVELSLNNSRKYTHAWVSARNRLSFSLLRNKKKISTILTRKPLNKRRVGGHYRS